ncbi:MAG: NAD(P)/FAD-dependent oxidoreductase [Gordonia sp.]|uniref:NAD(P)/FAD-dependent oxidoreductase n=1 Tax=Gordonia sp. (in: high G+C Gram-positive bacteria) TaxID=84139 RepID=UPI001E180735|nr:FAD/NAD(P)-binding oxidoreductase [Gordonia sp. (in: high G+C Gram-positive bacteria)]MCB1294605.1 NAD(P)/FAD-dependent oxidoreductase [Gordonia sp. (in: high G+C Gram-positive bacteria)]
MTAPRRVVIVGTGIAGITAAETLRSKGFDGIITVYGAEPELPYHRASLSKDLLDADLSPEAVALGDADFWANRRITVVTGTSVVTVRPGHRSVVLDTRDEVSYDALILATGGVARRPHWMWPGVDVLRTRRDAVAIQSAMRHDDRLIIVGGGLIGLELASNAAQAGKSVTLLEATDQILGDSLPAPLADHFADLHRAHGVNLLTQATVTNATPDRVDGNGFDTPSHGHVIVAAGAGPATALARYSEISSRTTGIRTDGNLRTSVRGVYAAGDVAQTPHPITGLPHRCGHWLTARGQGKAVAMTVLADLGFEIEPGVPPIPIARTEQYGVGIQMIGWPQSGDRLEVTGSLDDYDATVRVYDGFQMVGAVGFGDHADCFDLRDELDQSLAPLSIPPARIGLVG